MNRIKQFRTKLGIKQIDLCARLGVSQGTLSGYENDKFQPDTKTWLELSKIFACTVDELMGREAEDDTGSAGVAGEETRHNMLDDVELAFMGDYRQLTEDDKATIRDMIRLMRDRRKKEEGKQ